MSREHERRTQSTSGMCALWYSFRDCQFEDWLSRWTER
jgi:hypothetical protein